jgi:hypothetical protein
MRVCATSGFRSCGCTARPAQASRRPAGPLYAGLARSGARAGFADIDQLGICLPAPPDDPERYRLKERNLSAVAGHFRAAGCDAVVVSGDLGPSPGISSGTVPGACLTICRLRASPDELQRRLTSRRERPDFVAGALRQAEELDRTSVADACVGTDGLTVAEVARLVRERCGGWPPERAAGAGADDVAPASADEAAPTPAVGTDGGVARRHDGCVPRGPGAPVTRACPPAQSSASPSQNAFTFTVLRASTRTS